MLSVRRATIAVAAQLIFAFSNPASAGNPGIPSGLIQELHRWIDTETDLPKAGTSATIVFEDAQNIEKPSEMASYVGKTTRGLYDAENGTITLVRPWSADNPQDVAVLLHELVHHRQGGKYFYCEAAKEHAAYHIQKDWLAEHDLSLNVNWIAVVLASSCAVRDFHP